MSHSILQVIETRIEQLSRDEKRIPLDRLAHDLRVSRSATRDFATTVASMAADPEIQREIRAIEQEFEAAAEDGLEVL